MGKTTMQCAFSSQTFDGCDTSLWNACPCPSSSSADVAVCVWIDQLILLSNSFPECQDPACPDGLCDADEGEHVRTLLRGQPAEVIPWDEARVACETLGGHLATITSGEENAAVFALVEGEIANPWIGASDAEVEGDWHWVTGEPWDYTNWDEGESGISIDEDYLRIRRIEGEWNDCCIQLDTVSYVCEFD